MIEPEEHLLQFDKPGALVRDLYELPQGDYLRANKTPRELNYGHERIMLEYYRKYWPRTKLIVGIRHPVSCK